MHLVFIDTLGLVMINKLCIDINRKEEVQNYMNIVLHVLEPNLLMMIIKSFDKGR